jgi:hypothetical protein
MIYLYHEYEDISHICYYAAKVRIGAHRNGVVIFLRIYSQPSIPSWPIKNDAQ